MAGNAVIGALRVNLGLDSAEFQSGIKAVQGQIGGLGKVFSGLAAAGVFTAFTAGIGQAVGRIEEMRKLTAQFEKALVNVGNTADTTGAQLADFADYIERETGRAAEEIMAVGTNLATFSFNHDVFYNAIELANDMAAAWGGDLKQNVEGLARALADPEKGLAMLTKRGITFTEQQKAMIASFMQANDLVGAQGVVMAALNEQVKGVAAAGFTGLTRATANFHKSIEDLFEAIAGGLQVNLGLEMSLSAVAAAIDFVTSNMDTLGRIAGVAGTALATAMGPAIWSAMSVAAIAFGKAAVGAVHALRVAIATNPVGAIIVALSAAISAAFLFRDEISRVIGVDVGQIFADAANWIMRSFDLAFRNIQSIWSALPAVLGDITISTANAVIDGIESMINGAIEGINTLVRQVKPALAIAGIEVAEAGEVAFGEIENKWRNSLAGLDLQLQLNRIATGKVDYLAEVMSVFSGQTAAASAHVQGFSDILGEAASGGAAGVDALKDKVSGLGDAFAGVKDTMSELWGSMKSGLASMATGVTKAFFSTKDAAGKALDAIVSGLDQIASKALDMAFNGIFDMIFGALGGNSLGGGWGKAGGFAGFAGIFGIPGLATGGRTMTAGLVEVGERGREILNLPAGAQVIRHSDIDDAANAGGSGGNTFHIDARYAQRGVGAEIAQALEDFSKNKLPKRVSDINRNPLRR